MLHLHFGYFRKTPVAQALVPRLPGRLPGLCRGAGAGAPHLLGRAAHARRGGRECAGPTAAARSGDGRGGGDPGDLTF